MSRSVFVTGTDTDVGKTVVAAGILRALVRRGVRARAYKPVEAGEQNDARLLWQAAGEQGNEADVCRVRLGLPAAPAVAAAEERIAISRAALAEGYRAQAADADVVVVEGAGGLLVPLADDFSVADLAADVGAPLVVVARDALGTLNHTLLTLEAARRRGLAVGAVVLNRLRGAADPTVHTNGAVLARLGGVPVVGPFPRLGAVTLDAAADAVERLGLLRVLGLLR